MIYLLGIPTHIAVGTDLFEVAISGLYGAATYSYKGRVELVAALIMLCGAAVGAQIGTVATKYVKGYGIRIFFGLAVVGCELSIIMKLMSGISLHQADDGPGSNGYSLCVVSGNFTLHSDCIFERRPGRTGASEGPKKRPPLMLTRKEQTMTISKRVLTLLLACAPLLFTLGCTDFGKVEQGRVIAFDKQKGLVTVIRDWQGPTNLSMTCCPPSR